MYWYLFEKYIDGDDEPVASQFIHYSYKLSAYEMECEGIGWAGHPDYRTEVWLVDALPKGVWKYKMDMAQSALSGAQREVNILKNTKRISEREYAQSDHRRRSRQA